MFKTFVSLLLNFLAYGLFAQYASDSDKGYPLIKIVHEIERSSKKKVFYDKNLFLNDYVSEEVDLTNTETALIQLFSPLGYTPVEIKDAFIIVKKKEHTLSENVTRTQLVKLRGTIKSSSDQEPIIGATIQLGEYGAVSDT